MQPENKRGLWERAVATILDSARVHRGRVRMLASQGQCRDRALPPVHHSTRSNSMREMVFSQVESHVVSEFMRFPEKRKAWECDRRVGGRVTQGHIEVTTDTRQQW